MNLLGDKQINAFLYARWQDCVYSGILEQLKLNDDEVATVMGHEVAHALREHARERMGKNAATGIGASLLTQALGLGQVGRSRHQATGAQLLTLQFSRSDESEADLVGMELAARAGYDPRAGISLAKITQPARVRRPNGYRHTRLAARGLPTSRPTCPRSCPCTRVVSNRRHLRHRL